MAVSIQSIAQLIKDKEIDLAIKMLANLELSYQQLYLLSLLYRYEDRYEEEKAVIDLAFSLKFDKGYMKERLAWHKLPLFDRLVPRQKICLPRNPKKIPPQSVLSQLCFVTAGGSDTPFRECFIQLIESLKAISHYQNIPIMVIDTGLTDDDKVFIQKSFSNITIKDPGWDVDVPGIQQTSHKIKNLNGYKACSARPFIPIHFPGYRYYFWLDTDVWVQDARCLDLMIDQAISQGVSATLHYSKTGSFDFNGSWWNRMAEENHWILPEHTEFLKDKKVIAGGATCIDIQTGIFNLWQETFIKDFTYSKQAWGPDELSYLFSVYKKIGHLEYLGCEQAYSMNFSGPPIINTDGVLCAPDSAKIMGLFHLCGCKKDEIFHPVMESNVGIDFSTNKYGQVPRKSVSLHYRTWPWQDKSEIEDLLKLEAEKCLSN